MEVRLHGYVSHQSIKKGFGYDMSAGFPKRIHERLWLPTAEKPPPTSIYRQIKTLIALRVLKLALIWLSCLKLPRSCIPCGSTLTRTHSQNWAHNHFQIARPWRYCTAHRRNSCHRLGLTQTGTHIHTRSLITQSLSTPAVDSWQYINLLCLSGVIPTNTHTLTHTHSK